MERSRPPFPRRSAATRASRSRCSAPSTRCAWQLSSRRSSSGPTHGEWAAVVAGIAIYFASWLPLLFEPRMATQPFVALGPAVTPALFLAPLARLGRSRLFGGLAAALLAAHIAHQLC